MQLAPFDPTKKKKKKKVLVQETADEATEKVAEKMENISGMIKYNINLREVIVFVSHLAIIIREDG